MKAVSRREKSSLLPLNAVSTTSIASKFKQTLILLSIQLNMSRRTAVVEEFDDDTDLPLPSRPVLNTGPRGPLLEEIGYSDEEDSESESDYAPAPGQASQSQPPSRTPNSSGQSQGAPSNTVTDITPYKTYVLATVILGLV